MARFTRRPRGLFISFEGIEGSGKTTQIARSAAWLRNQGWTVLETREPGGTTIAEQVRDVLLNRRNLHVTALTEAFLVMAARCQHVTEVIKPALSAGTIVLCDRFAESTLAYQGFGRGVPLPQLRRLNRMATGGLTPDLTILLDVPVSVGLQRRRAHRDVNRLDMEEVSFHDRVRKGFLHLARHASGRIRMIKADGPLEYISDQVLQLIATRVRRPEPSRRRRVL